LLSLWEKCRRQKTWCEDKDDDDDNDGSGSGSGSCGGNVRWSFPRRAQKINTTHYSQLCSSFFGLANK
jgi:hypothetical protein